MTTIQITPDKVKAAYEAATSEETKKVLSALFSDQLKELDEPKDIKERVKSFADACKLVPVTDNQKILLDYNGNDKALIASQSHLKISIIAKALNEGWYPDWSNSKEYKYYPWFKAAPGVGFSFHVFVFDFTFSGVGSRLCFKSRELAEYAGKQFIDIYNDFLQ